MVLTNGGIPVALVSGASRGIGRDLAIGLAARGFAVGITARTRSLLDETRDEILDAGGRCAAVVGDVTSWPSVVAVVEQLTDELGPITLLVNNAALIDDVPILEGDPEDWWRVVETNLRGPYHLCRAVIPGMVDRRAGRVINVNSRASMQPRVRQTAYSASKAALSRLTDNLAAGLEGTGVSVFDLAPGFQRTEMTTRRFPSVDASAFGTSEQVLDGVIALASGTYDALSGRFLHVTDDFDLVLAALVDPTNEGRRLRLLPYSEADEVPRSRPRKS